MLDYLLNMFTAFLATMGFSITFNAPRKELPFCGLCGLVSWMGYYCVQDIANGKNTVLAVLIAEILAASLCRLLSYARKIPLTIYLIGSIMPLVPGSGIYYTMSAVIGEDIGTAVAKGVETLKTAGVIAIGIIIVLSMPRAFFDFGKKTEKVVQNNG